MDSTNGEVREKGRAPMRIVMKDRQPFIFAGLWDLWRGGPEAGELYTFKSSPTMPIHCCAPIHHRMPVIIDKRAEAIWLDPVVLVGYFAAGPA